MKHIAAFTLGIASWLMSMTTALAQPTSYQVGNTTLSISTLAQGLDTPWELLWGPDNQLYVTERGGRVSRINPATGQTTLLLTIPDVTETGESGLLGMAFGSIGSLTGRYNVFLVYNYTDNGQLKEKLVRYQYLAGDNTLTNPQVILGNIPAATTHSGSRLLLLPDNTLLMTTGDAQDLPSAQNRQTLLGKILRLNQDGSVPSDNPTPGSLVYTLGHRNPQGLVRAPSGRLYSSEHGPGTDDELNLIEPGRNYGWPNVEGFCNLPAEQTFCQTNNVREPLAAWTPTLAVAGLTHYNHPAVPEWQNSLLMVSLRTGLLKYLRLSADGLQVQQQTDLWSGTYGRLRAVCVSPQGRVYVATSNRDGRGNPAATDDRILVLENRAYSPNAARANRITQLTIYPNPVPVTTATLQLPPLLAPATAQLTDLQGRTIWRGQLIAGQRHLVLPAGVAGLYLLRLRQPDGQELLGRLLRQ